MTHAESQDLLLDLAYGELDPVRARELEGHLAGCDECQREKAALDEARRLTAPLREMEEPSQGFDEKILAAARTQAQIDHEGNIGQVVEVSGNVKPLGLEPARIDAHAPVSARQERRKPRWATRLMLGGSVAAAATLALVVSTNLQNRHAQEVAWSAASDADAYKIRVEPVSEKAQPPPTAPADLAQNEALREAQKTAAPPPPPPMQAVQPPARRAQKKVAVADDVGGSGGDAFDQSRGAVGGAVAPAPAAEAKPAAEVKVAAESKPAAPPAEKDVATAGNVLKQEPAPPPAAEKRKAMAERAPMVAVASKPAAGAAGAPPAATVVPPPSGDDYRTALKLEAEAQVARHAGKYADAASMYRQAAALRRTAGDQSDAAWDLAHAVECFAAVGMFDDGFRVRDELTNSYPSEITAISAAKRALREVDSVPAAKQ